MDLKLRIRKRNQPEWLVWILVFFPFTIGMFFDFLQLPSLIKYVADVVWLLLVVLIVLNSSRKNLVMNTQTKIAAAWITLFLVFTFVSYIFKYQSALYYIMGVRNNFRFYFAFIAFAIFLAEEDIKAYLKAFDVLFWINAVVMLFQYFVLGYKQDFLGGIFGTQSGCNGFVNIFFVIICAKSVTDYLSKREKTMMMLSKCATALLLATFAEIKFFYIEFVAIIIVAVLVSGNSWRKILVVIGGIIGVVVCVNLMLILFPYFAELTNFENMITHQSEGYTGSDTIGRLGAISQVSDLFLNTTAEKLTGLGLGNCETSNIAFLNTPFYQSYGYIRYFWFSTAHVTLETGYLGFALFTGFFFLLSVLYVFMISRNSYAKEYARIAIVVAVCCVLIIIYNSSLRTEAGYMIYFVLSLPFAALKNSKNGVEQGE